MQRPRGSSTSNNTSRDSSRSSRGSNNNHGSRSNLQNGKSSRHHHQHHLQHHLKFWRGEEAGGGGSSSGGGGGGKGHRKELHRGKQTQRSDSVKLDDGISHLSVSITPSNEPCRIYSSDSYTFCRSRHSGSFYLKIGAAGII